MKLLLFGVVCSFLVVPAGAATASGLQEEKLTYSVNWPSGLNLGEGHLSARHVKSTGAGTGSWELEFGLDAAIPGFAVHDEVRALATDDLCSREFQRNLSHGQRKTKEKTTFGAEGGFAKRETLDGGGSSNIDVGACGRDALTFLYYVRRELVQGRLPAGQKVLFGSGYDVSLEYGGSQSVVLNGSRVEVDRLVASFRGPSSSRKFEIFFSHDESRTPVIIRVPFDMGTFSMELVR